MPTKGERGKATDFSIAAIMAPRGPSFGHYHLQGIGNAAATANTSLECPTGKAFVANSHLDHREFSITFPPFLLSRKRHSKALRDQQFYSIFTLQDPPTQRTSSSTCKRVAINPVANESLPFPRVRVSFVDNTLQFVLSVRVGKRM